MDFLKDFGVQPVLLAAQVVNFLILLFILNKLLYKPILKVLSERRQKIEESLRNAQDIEKKLLQTEEDRQNLLAKASEEGQNIVDDAKKQADLLIEDAKVKAEISAQKILEEAQSKIQIERDNMRWELQKEFSKIVMLIVQKVAGKILDKQSQKQLIEKAVKEIRS